VDGEVYAIGELISDTLENDCIQPPKPVYQTVLDEFRQHFHDAGFKAETFFKFHPDPTVSALAIDMIAEKYQFSQSDMGSRLGELVKRYLFEIKLTVTNMQIEELETRLKEAQAKNDWETQLAILKHQPELLAQRNEICRILGNRVINI